MEQNAINAYCIALNVFLFLIVVFCTDAPQYSTSDVLEIRACTWSGHCSQIIVYWSFSLHFNSVQWLRHMKIIKALQPFTKGDVVHVSGERWVISAPWATGTEHCTRIHSYLGRTIEKSCWRTPPRGLNTGPSTTRRTGPKYAAGITADHIAQQQTTFSRYREYQ